MKTNENWQATRELRDSTDPTVKVEVQLGYPEMRTSDEWACPFRIVGLDAEIFEYGIGVDALQAIMMGIEGIATYLRSSGRSLSWIGMPGETGIRRQIPMMMGPEFANEIEAHIDAKIEGFNKARENAAK
jgi:hypothetical protein